MDESWKEIREKNERILRNVMAIQKAFDPVERINRIGEILRDCAKTAGVPWPPKSTVILRTDGKTGRGVHRKRKEVATKYGVSLSRLRSKPIDSIEGDLRVAWLRLKEATEVMTTPNDGTIDPWGALMCGVDLGAIAERVQLTVKRYERQLLERTNRQKIVRSIIQLTPDCGFHEMVEVYQKHIEERIKDGSGLEKRLAEDFAFIRQDLGLA